MTVKQNTPLSYLEFGSSLRSFLLTERLLVADVGTQLEHFLRNLLSVEQFEAQNKQKLRNRGDLPLGDFPRGDFLGVRRPLGDFDLHSDFEFEAFGSSAMFCWRKLFWRPWIETECILFRSFTDAPSIIHNCTRKTT